MNDDYRIKKMIDNQGDSGPMQPRIMSTKRNRDNLTYKGIVHPLGEPASPHLLRSSALDVPKYAFAPRALRPGQTGLVRAGPYQAYSPEIKYN
jgi:hypothetical protein